MRKFTFSKRLKKTLKKLLKKDRKRYGQLMNKAKEIILSEDPNHYKNLQSPLQRLKRVHIDSSFVLTFTYDQENDKLHFEDFHHHDSIYKT